MFPGSVPSYLPFKGARLKFRYTGQKKKGLQLNLAWRDNQFYKTMK
jgi:hypothetical protein